MEKEDEEESFFSTLNSNHYEDDSAAFFANLEEHNVNESSFRIKQEHVKRKSYMEIF